MDKINGFAITRLSLSGFKCFKNPVSFDFGDTTFITASNGLGKSSIADAIAFAFIGTSFYGEKALDRLRNRNSVEMEISVDFVDDTGKSHNLTRYRKRDITSIALDGYTARQSDLVEIFGDKDIFLSILNPLYFINVLGDSGKGLLEKILPVVSKEDVLVALGNHSREILESQNLLSPETFIKNRRSELKELEEALIGYRSQKELLDYQMAERSKELKNLQSSVDTITIEIEELARMRNSEFNPEVEKSVLMDLHKRRTKLLSDMTHAPLNGTIQSKLKEFSEVESSIRKLESTDYVSQYTAQIAEVEASLKALYDKHGKISSALNNTVVGYKCPTCATSITPDNVDVVRTGLQCQLSDLINKGKKEKAKLANIRVQDDAERSIFKDQKTASLATEKIKLEQLNQKLCEFYISSELDAEGFNEQLASFDTQIAEQERRIANGNLTAEQVLRASELDRLKQEYLAKIKTLNSISNYDFATLIEKTEAEILRLRRLMNEAIQYVAKRVELMLKDLKMDNTEIVLTEIIKTSGEIKDCFRFSYDGRDYRCLSLSEKVRAGFEISLLIQRLSNRRYPIFVDNSESICSFGNTQPSGQVILSRVVKNQELQVICKTKGQHTEVA